MARTKRAAVRRLPGARTPFAAAAFLALSAGCADRSLLGVESPDADYWKGYVRDTGSLFSEPARWGKGDWLAIAGTTAAGFGVWALDAEIRDCVLRSRSPVTECLAGMGEAAGGLRVLVPGLAAGYGLGCAFDDARLKEASLLGTEGLALSALATRVLEHLFGRARPYTGLGAEEFIGPSCDDDYASWPSGRSAAAFAVATAFHLEYRKKWVSILAYSLAALAAWSRLHDDVHWASDVLSGASVGIFVTSGIFRARRRRKERTPPRAAYVFP